MTGVCECGCGNATSIAHRTNRTYGHIQGQHVRFLVGHAGRVALESRFWRKVFNVGGIGCWPWVAGANTRGGYGALRGTGSRMDSAHRVSWKLRHGAIPAGLLVCHRCDYRPCVRPSHLFLGTASDNQRDMVTKGRSLHGAHNAMAVLDADTIRAIRRAYASGGRSQDSLGREYGVRQGTISDIVNRKTWRHITEGADAATRA